MKVIGRERCNVKNTGRERETKIMIGRDSEMEKEI